MDALSFAALEQVAKLGVEGVNQQTRAENQRLQVENRRLQAELTALRNAQRSEADFTALRTEFDHAEHRNGTLERLIDVERLVQFETLSPESVTALRLRRAEFGPNMHLEWGPPLDAEGVRPIREVVQSGRALFARVMNEGLPASEVLPDLRAIQREVGVYTVGGTGARAARRCFAAIGNIIYMIERHDGSPQPMLQVLQRVMQDFAELRY